jgi:hypothetical protein
MELHKLAWLLLVAPALVLVVFSLPGESDRDRFDRLQVGMTAAQVQDVLFPPRAGRYGHFRVTVGENETLHINDRMILTIESGVLVRKEWKGEELELPPPRD